MNRERLFSRLGSTCYASLIDATALGRQKQHAFVDLDHWFLCLLNRQDSDCALLLAELGCDVNEIRHRIEVAIERVSLAGESMRDISPLLDQCIGPAITWSQIAVPSERVRSGHLLLSWLDDASTARWISKLDTRLGGNLNVTNALSIFEKYGHQWHEALETVSVKQTGAQTDLAGSSDSSGRAVLNRWATCMTDLAARGELDPVVGRHDELRMVIDTLLRRRQNNPILVGEAGVGKTAVVEALAQKIHDGQVPALLKNAQVWSLDIIRMQAGTSVRGEFEQRLRSVIDAVISSECPIILFCDEAHTLMGAGGTAGTGDAVNLIKPMLARGQLRMVAATTWAEYKQFIEPDAALTRRFQAIVVEEPSDSSAIDMLRIIAPRFAAHHGVQILESALASAVKLSRRYLPSRQLPDKAISLLDTACARVAMSQSCEPPELDRLRHETLAVEHALSWRENDRRMGVTVQASDGLVAQQQELYARVTEVNNKFESQRDDVRVWLRQLESQVGQADQVAITPVTWSPDGHIWVRPWVDENAIAQVISEWTGVPCPDLAQDDADRWVHMAASLVQRVHGQDLALKSITQALQVSRAGLNDPSRPLGVMLLAGPTGTGKSQTALVLAELLFGGERNLIQFNMNEFQESHTVSTLKGAPPGYVGYGKGGRLTEAVRKKPYSVLLLDEFDRAHPDIHEMFYQVFDRGWMEDGEGRRISFRNCLILLTTNLGSQAIEEACQIDAQVTQARLEFMVRQGLETVFAPALLGRIQVIAYRPLTHAALTAIARQALDEVGQRLAEQNLAWVVDDAVAPWIAQAVSRHPSSARAVRDLLRQHVVPDIARGVLLAQADARGLRGVHLNVDDQLILIFESADGCPEVAACA